MTRTVFAVLAIGGWLAAWEVSAAEDCLARKHTCGQVATRTLYGAPACAAPNGYSLSPGCCEFSPTLCDNPWANYCEEKARIRACWAPCGRAGCRSCGTAAATLQQGPCTAAGQSAPGAPTPADRTPGGTVEPAGAVPAPAGDPQATRMRPLSANASSRQVWQPTPEPMTMRPANPWTR